MSKKPTTLRVQAYVRDQKVSSALTREARQGKTTMSEAASRAIARGLQKSVPADPDDRLLTLERALRDHMRSTARDMIITQELLIELARAFFFRLPDVAGDGDPLVKAAVEQRIERLLDATAARISRGGSVDRSEAEAVAEGRPPARGRPASDTGNGQYPIAQ